MVSKLHVMPTMDCEPPVAEISEHAREKSGTGPRDYEHSRQSMRGYNDLLGGYGYAPTYFIQPKVTHSHREFFLEAAEGGACLGLHLHPYKFDERYTHEVGAYPADEQHAILAEATAVWANGLGQRPRYFRPGKLSANDDTFRLLEQLGFEGGTVSKPGTVNVDDRTDWGSAHPYPHRVHHGFRQVPGDGEFVNVPDTVDLSTLVDRSADRTRQSFQALAIEHGPDVEELPATVGNVLDQLERDQPPLGQLVFGTHNNVDYFDPAGEHTQKLETLLSIIERQCDDRGIEPVAAPIDMVVEKVRDLTKTDRDRSN